LRSTVGNLLDERRPEKDIGKIVRVADAAIASGVGRRQVTTCSAARPLTPGRSIAGLIGVIATRWPIVWGGHCRTDGSGPNSGGANPYPHARTHVGSAINPSAINAATIDAATIDASCANTTRADSSAPC